jgi:hypothetical protein
MNRPHKHVHAYHSFIMLWEEPITMVIVGAYNASLINELRESRGLITHSPNPDHVGGFMIYKGSRS